MLRRLFAIVFTLLVASVSAYAAPCGGHYGYVHWYPVPNLDAAAKFLDTAADFSRGSRADRVSPWNRGGPKFASIDFCPKAADGRLVRLAHVPQAARAKAKINEGVLTIHSRDLAASRAAGKGLAQGKVRTGTQKGVRKVWFEDTYGNTFIVEETKP
jgi:hypothetical protein